jgi:phosphate/sulfate permease
LQPRQFLPRRTAFKGFTPWPINGKFASANIGEIPRSELMMIALTEQFEKRSRAFAATVSVVLVIAIGMVDYLTGYVLVFSAFYLLPVSLAAWYVGGGFGAAISVMSVAAWLTGDVAAGVKYSSLFVPIWNGAIALTVYFVVVKALVSLRDCKRNWRSGSASEPSPWPMKWKSAPGWKRSCWRSASGVSARSATICMTVWASI